MSQQPIKETFKIKLNLKPKHKAESAQQKGHGSDPPVGAQSQLGHPVFEPAPSAPIAPSKTMAASHVSSRSSSMSALSRQSNPTALLSPGGLPMYPFNYGVFPMHGSIPPGGMLYPLLPQMQPIQKMADPLSQKPTKVRKTNNVSIRQITTNDSTDPYSHAISSIEPIRPQVPSINNNTPPLSYQQDSSCESKADILLPESIISLSQVGKAGNMDALTENISDEVTTEKHLPKSIAKVSQEMTPDPSLTSAIYASLPEHVFGKELVPVVDLTIPTASETLLSIMNTNEDERGKSIPKELLKDDLLIGTEESRIRWTTIDAAKKAERRVNDVPVINDPRLLKKSDRKLGYVIYTGCKRKIPYSSDPEHLQLFLLPRFTGIDEYSSIEVRIPYQFLSYQNESVKCNVVWGTDVYSDDSDPVAAIIHSGLYIPFDMPLIQPSNSTASLSGIIDKSKSAGNESACQLIQDSGPMPLVGGTDPNDHLANHDVRVTLRILPKLRRYFSSERFGLLSRLWGSGHDGMSFRVESVEVAKKGSVQASQRKQASKNWFTSRLVGKEMKEGVCSAAMADTVNHELKRKALRSNK